ncbi:MAG: SMEK domain-containing protein [Rickettsiaceae bacterium]|nr:SMEK domain-containing protein [Rickettsiaceae bacterium]
MVTNDCKLTLEMCGWLGTLKQRVDFSQTLGMLDGCIACEKLFMGVFNMVYNLSLENLNLFESNYPAIDLGDKVSGVCYQITLENKLSKIKDTRAKYYKYNIDKKYPNLKIFIFAKKPLGRPNDNGVFYTEDLIKDIYKLNLEIKNKLLKFLIKELRPLNNSHMSNEIKVIQELITIISKAKPDANTSDWVEKPYPKEKLSLRFKNYKDQILYEYKDSFRIYGDFSKTLKDYKVYDDGIEKRVKSYLRRISRESLNDKEHNARQALDNVIEKIKNLLEIDYWEGALRFYILSQLMDCDIFPLNQKEVNLIEERLK